MINKDREEILENLDKVIEVIKEYKEHDKEAFASREAMFEMMIGILETINQEK